MNFFRLSFILYVTVFAFRNSDNLGLANDVTCNRSYLISCNCGFMVLTQMSSIFSFLTVHNMTFSIKDFFSKCDQSLRKLRVWSLLLKKSLMENFIFCAVPLFMLSGMGCIRTLSNIADEAFGENFRCLKTGYYFRKTLQLRYLTGFWMRLCFDPVMLCYVPISLTELPTQR